VLGIQDGFRGLVENRILTLDDATVSGVLTRGGTILGTSRDKPHSMPMGGRLLDMTDAAVHNARRHQMDCLVCLGGGGTAKNAYRLWQKAGLNVMTLPKTIDNDVFGTDVSFGFDTAVSIATEAIDRLHTTATSHHRLIVCEVMGHRAGWLALHSGIAGGADVILIPELPYDPRRVVAKIQERAALGLRFSIVVVGEGAGAVGEGESEVEAARPGRPARLGGAGERLAQQLRDCQVGHEVRVTVLGHLQRGGTPTAFDRLLATRFGAHAAQLCAERRFGRMVSIRGGHVDSVAIAEAGRSLARVDPSGELATCARAIGIELGQ